MLVCCCWINCFTSPVNKFRLLMIIFWLFMISSILGSLQCCLKGTGLLDEGYKSGSEKEEDKNWGTSKLRYVRWFVVRGVPPGTMLSKSESAVACIWCRRHYQIFANVRYPTKSDILYTTERVVGTWCRW
jgi:hypothetical protein